MADKSAIESAAAASGAAAQAAMTALTEAPANGRSGGKPMPIEWTQSVKEINWNNRNDGFGAESAGDNIGAPMDSIHSGSHKVAKTEPEALLETVETPTEEVVVEAEATGDEVDPELAEAAAKVDAATKEAEEATSDEKVEAKDPEKEVPAAEEKPSALRRKALDALKAEGEKREITARLKNEREARVKDKAAHDAATAKLTRAPLEERLRMIGIRDKDQLLEIAVSGTIDEKALSPEPKAPPVDPEKAALLERLAKVEAREAARDADANAQAQAQSLALVKTVLLQPEIAGHYTLADEHGLTGTLEYANTLWAKAGSPPSQEAKMAIIQQAAREAEAFYEDKAKGILAAAAAKNATKAPETPAVPVVAKNSVTAGVVPVAKKPAVVGKRMAARPSVVEDTMDPNDPRRDWMIKKEFGLL